jgi:hypothetical protein
LELHKLLTGQGRVSVYKRIFLTHASFPPHAVD